jgi:phosphoserine phosphatase RsbU/P
VWATHTDAVSIGAVTALDDPARRQALEQRGLLDTPAEQAFDRLTGLATRVLGVPVALVSLVTDDRQFFKSQCGLPEPVASTRQTGLSHSFCQHVVRRADALVVEDARVDPLVRDNLAIPDLGVVAYAGVPLTTPDGHVLGSFCAIDTEPRQWADEDVELLHELAATAMEVVELRAQAVAAAGAAVRLQEALVPEVPELRRGRASTFYRPGEDRLLLGGDFFGVAERADGALDVLVGDVAGRGPEAAAFAAVLRSAWEMAKPGSPPDEVLALLARAAAPRAADGAFASAVCLHVHPDRRTAAVSGAGHPAPVLLTADGARELELSNGPLLGVGAGPWPCTRIELSAGAAVLLFTDGLVEGRTAPGSDDRLGPEGLVEEAGRLVGGGAWGTELLDALVDVAERRNCGPRADDLAAVLLEPDA